MFEQMRLENRKILFLCCFLFIAVIAKAQSFAVKTNALYWFALSPNASIEAKLHRQFTADLQAVYNPWEFKNGKKMKFWLAQPELRYWLCEAFEGHFLGVHLHAAQFYAVPKNKVYDGYLAGGGITYGYNWILSPRWNLEALVGVGYARLWYKEYPNLPCLKCYENKKKNYLGPTKIALSVSYMF